MEEGFAAVESDRADAHFRCIIDQVVEHLGGELLARHEAALIEAANTALIAARGEK